MSASSTELPIHPNFPDPRLEPKMARRKSLSLRMKSVDAMLKEEATGEDVSNELSDMQFDDRAAALREEADALQQKEKENAKLLAETLERVRIVRETEILLANRERLLDKREAVLSAKVSNRSSDANIEALEQTLEETRNNLAAVNKVCEEKEQVISKLHEEIAELEDTLDQATTPGQEMVPQQPQKPSDYDSITHETLQEQVAFLKEREAFIEQSENVLFDKAQNLQEWETRLQQVQHDQVKAELEANGKGGSSSGPIEFPREAAGS